MAANAAAVAFWGDQLAAPETRTLPFNSNPIKLAIDDIALFFYESLSLPGTILPWFGKYRDDELTCNFENAYCIVLHGILVVLQLLFIASVLIAPFIPVLPLWVFIVYFFGFVVANYYFCNVFINGPYPTIESSVGHDIDQFYKEAHDKERWIFLNGVSVGQHWLQSNVNRLSRTFGRPVLGVHNPTTGIVFDVIQCLIQRCFCYATMDIRNAYINVKAALENPQYNKVVFIVHSQGAIEGSMIVDWLLDEVPQDLLYQLEVYTFGNASNHMNNPHKTVPGLKMAKQQPSRIKKGKPSIDTQIAINGVSQTPPASSSVPEKAIGHIEHYAHTQDFVARWGVLHFTKAPSPPKPATPANPTPANEVNANDPYINRFMGRIFIQKASGHMLNQHYLQSMFTLADGGIGCAETNPFMESKVSTTESATDAINKRVSVRDSLENIYEDGTVVEPGVNLRNVGSPDDVAFPGVQRSATGSLNMQVKELSRLWQYRNGRSPAPSS